MKRWQRGAAAIVAAVTCAGVAGASATSLGGITSQQLTGIDQPTPACDTTITVTLTGTNPHTTADISAYDTSCVGETAQIVIYAADGSPLGVATSALGAAPTAVTLNTPVTGANTAGAAAQIGGRGVAVTLSVPGGNPVSSNLVVTADTWWNWCADVTVTTTSPTPIPWTWQIVLDGTQSARVNNDPSKPLNPLSGTPNNMWNGGPGLPGAWNAGTKTLTAQGAAYYSTISASSPHTFGFCVTRTDPPPVAPYTCAITGGNNWGAGFQFNFQVITTSQTATHWTCTFTFPNAATSPPSPAGTVTAVFNGAWCYQAGTLTVTSNQTWMMVANNSPYSGGFQGVIPGTGGPTGPNC